MDAEKILKRYENLKSRRGVWEKVWRAVAKYCMPELAPINMPKSITAGGSRDIPLDTTGCDCVNLLASFIYSNTVFSGDQWFDLSAKNGKYDKNENERAKSELLQDIVNVILGLITSSNFDHVYRQFLTNYVPFGTGVFHWEFNTDNELICRQWSITDNIVIEENSKGEIDTVFRYFEYTARQAVQEFGEENLPKCVLDAYNDVNEKDKHFNFLNIIMPRADGERDKSKTTPKNKPIADICIEMSSKKIVRDSGRDRFPYCCARFYNMGEVYGRSCGMKAIPALRAISMATWAYLKNVEFNAKPMIFAPPSMYDRMRIEADTVNAWDSSLGDVKIWSPSGDMNSPLEFAERKKDEVRKIFYVDRIQYLDEKRMTATEAQLRYDEMIQSFSPVLAGLQSEFFTPFIEGLVEEVVARGMVNIPDTLKSENGSLNFTVEYKSRLNSKLKGAFNSSIMSFLNLIASYGQVKATSPVASIYLNDDSIIKEFAKNCNVSKVALNTDEEIEMAIQMQNEQQQAMQMQQMMKPVDPTGAIDPTSIVGQAMEQQQQ